MPQLAANDVVPELRHDLIFSGSPQGLGDDLLSVTNLASGEELRLRGFECSLARMLDGHRTAREVIEAAGDVGLPLSLGGLDGFVKKLQSLELIDGKRRASAFPSAWNPRERWDEQTRAQYRQALRDGRTGRLDQAAVVLDRLLEQAPQLPEAQTLRQTVQQQHQAPSPAEFLSVFAEAEARWRAQPEAADLAAVRSPWLRPYGLLGFWLAVAALALLTLAATVVPLPHTVRLNAQLAPVSSARVVAPRTGTIASVRVKLGQQVEPKQVLFSYDLGATVWALEKAIERVDQQRRELAAVLQRPGASGPGDSTRVAQAEAAVAQAARALDDARRASGDPFSETARALEGSLNRAFAEAEAAQAQLEQARPTRLLSTLHQLEAEVRQLELELLGSDVRAPAGGQIAAITVREGEVAFVGMDAVRIDDRSQLKVVATINPDDVKGLAVGAPAQLVTQGRLVAATVQRIGKDEVEVLVTDPADAPAPAPVVLELRGTPRPLLRLR